MRFMKHRVFLSLVVISKIANAGQMHTVMLDEYLFRGTLVGMTNSLQEQLAKGIVTACGQGAKITASFECP